MENGKLTAYPLSGNHTGNPDTLGLTKREYFAGLAMQGLLTRVPQRQDGDVALGILESQRIAQESIIMADLILKQLKEAE